MDESGVGPLVPFVNGGNEGGDETDRPPIGPGDIVVVNEGEDGIVFPGDNDDGDYAFYGGRVVSPTDDDDDLWG